MALPYTVEVVEDCHVSPPPNSVPPTSLPLTFFDVPHLLVPPVERIFFYEYPHPSLHFTNSILPSLKHSLSLTLQHFFPLAGTLIYPPHPTKPHILYADGDSVSFKIAESTGDLAHLLSNYQRDVTEFHSLVPHLPPLRVSSDANVKGNPLLALQITIFPNSGICIGITSSHVVADGRTSIHFMKSWASIFRSQGDLSCIEKSLPFYDRSVIEDPKGLQTIFLNQYWSWWPSTKEGTTAPISVPIEGKIRATFVMGRHDIEKLKQWISTQCKNLNESQPLHLSTFVVTCAFIWVCLVKSQGSVTSNIDQSSSDEDKLYRFAFVADRRNHHELCVPIRYFGNCLTVHYVQAERGVLVGENGVIGAAKAIGSKVKELESGVLRGAEKWLSDIKELFGMGNYLSVAGSPKLGVYETDFGWGRPRKVEVVHIDVSGAISLAECRDEEGGIEVGVALSRIEMEAFISIFEQGRQKFHIC
ncbi:hypothetical protein L1049_023745 [Liquidambar formosana]|uniref:Uncharacterized protein n=1 Tax=Liquidambar formosana TaxID=63359 RepID=A0AAP0S0S3_LIQFO